MSAGFEFPTYGRGVDPSPDLDFGFMFRHPDEKIGCVAPQKIIYEQKLEDFLKTKLQAQIEKKRDLLKSGENEIPDIIKFLKEEFLRLTRKTATRLEKGVFIAELKKNPLLAEVFGFDENSKDKEIEEQVENIGTEEGINMDKFLLFYQVSKNNLLKPIHSKTETQSSVTNDSFMEQNKQRTDDMSRAKGTRFAITVPEPFKFDRREKRKGMSIRERRLKEMLEEKEKEIKESIKITYKATPVPPEVKIPRYEQIMKEQEERRMQVKQNSIAITKANEQPFSFYYRDLTKTKPEPAEMPKHVFTANPVPWTTSVPLYDKIVSERELARKERISKAAIESLNLAMMPPRMELYYRQLQKASKTPKPKPKTKKFKAKAVPDFRRLQADFQSTLDACKQSFNPTKPEPFAFNETQSSFDYLKLLDKEADANKKWGQPSKAKRSKSLSILNKPKIIPSTTEKTKAMIEYKLAQKREAKMKEALKMQEEEERRMKHEMMKGVVQNCSLIKDNTAELKRRREESIKNRREELEEKEREYYEQKAEIYERVSKRPLLVEQVAMKKLAKDLEQLGPVRELLSQEESNEYSQDMLNQSY
ncbi:unnamed protein product [Blepharisma stoltei]|uniref:Uncharacterized protein n=1 Tax=Blepharisma stoltei TaxID=1481888 RepID=A0AAU9IAJ6_9CILI|nr:unnamed protein product [Blepharisma stoltei]